MSADLMTSSRCGGTLRWLGGLQLITACGIVLFWIHFFALENRRPDNDPTYLAFERSFAPADLLWLTPLLCLGGWFMRRGRPLATPCSIAAGGAMVFLGVVDAAFNLQQGRYMLSLFDGLLNGFINLYCLIVGLMLVYVTWRGHTDGFAVSPADQTSGRPAGRAESPGRSAGRARRSKTVRMNRSASRLAGRHVAITGGSSGIGLATAKQLAALGAHVVILARNGDRLESAAADIDAVKHESALPCLALTCDVADQAQVAGAFGAMAHAGRQPEILINSAGISQPGYFQQQPVDLFERHMQVNYLGTVHTTKQALAAMMARGEGHIVNLSSVAGFMGVFGYAGYGASKFAVYGLSEALRAELRPHGIAVSVVCPPDTDTPQLRQEDEIKPPETKAIGGSIEVMTAEQVADAIIRGITRRRFLIIPGLDAKLLPVVLGLARSLVHRVLDRKVAKVAQESHGND